MRWLGSIDDTRFFTILDILLDIKQARGTLGRDRVSIALLPMKPRFLAPRPGIGTSGVDRSIEARADSVSFLKDMGVLRDYQVKEKDHPWGSTLDLDLVENMYTLVLEAAQREYKTRGPRLVGREEAGDAAGRAPGREGGGAPWEFLHPALAGLCKEPFRRGRRRQGLDAALDHVMDRLAALTASRTGRTHAGRELIRRALAPGEGVLFLGDQRTAGGRLAQESAYYLFLGAWCALEGDKPKGKRGAAPDLAQCMELLFLLGRLAGLLEAAA